MHQRRCELSRRLTEGDRSITRSYVALWVNGLVEKHSWLSAGLIWNADADSGQKALPEDHDREEAPQPGHGMPCINLIKYWEEGSSLIRSVNAPPLPSFLQLPFRILGTLSQVPSL